MIIICGESIFALKFLNLCAIMPGFFVYGLVESPAKLCVAYCEGSKGCQSLPLSLSLSRSLFSLSKFGGFSGGVWGLAGSSDFGAPRRQGGPRRLILARTGADFWRAPVLIGKSGRAEKRDGFLHRGCVIGILVEPILPPIAADWGPPSPPISTEPPNAFQSHSSLGKGGHRNLLAANILRF